MGNFDLMDAVSVVQDVYVTGALFEDAGDGQMRVVRYVRHAGHTVPIFSYVTPCVAMIRDGTAAVEFARNILREQVAESH